MQELRKVDVPTTSDRTRLSLLFGYTVAEGICGRAGGGQGSGEGHLAVM
jgi:hypothetical protein